jgi:hypothetical protein
MIVFKCKKWTQTSRMEASVIYNTTVCYVSATLPAAAAAVF